MSEPYQSAINILRKNVDEVAILAALARLKLQHFEELTESDEMVLAALRRSSEDYRDADLETTAKMLANARLS